MPSGTVTKAEPPKPFSKSFFAFIKNSPLAASPSVDRKIMMKGRKSSKVFFAVRNCSKHSMPLSLSCFMGS